MEFVNEFTNKLVNNNSFRILCIVIIFDTVFGVLRAIREHEINSSIGIDGIIRKVGMLFSVIFLSLIDMVMSINLIYAVPENLKNALNLQYVGFNELFNLLFIVFELLSIFKNMVLCKLPIPKALQDVLENALKKFTGEIEKNTTVVIKTIEKVDALNNLEKEDSKK